MMDPEAQQLIQDYNDRLTEYEAAAGEVWVKGGPGSGSWEGPGEPRFAWAPDTGGGTGGSPSMSREGYEASVIERTNELRREDKSTFKEWKVRSFEEYKSKAEGRMKKMLSESQPFVRVHVGALEQILKDGVIKNQFETRSSSAAYYPDRRRAVEEMILGVSPDTPPEQRPIYGYLSKSKDGMVNSKRELDMYGGVAIRLKSNLKNESTFTVGDSLDTTVTLIPEGLGGGWIPNPVLVPQPINEPTIYAAPAGRLDYEGNDWRRPEGSPAKDIDDCRDYFEIQIPRRVTVKDIASVVFSKPPSKAMTKRLDGLGISHHTSRTKPQRRSY